MVSERLEAQASTQIERRLTPLDKSHARFRFESLFIAELKLLLNGQRWWWYGIAIGLIIAQAFNSSRSLPHPAHHRLDMANSHFERSRLS